MNDQANELLVKSAGDALVARPAAAQRGHDGDPAGDEVPGAPGKPGEPG